MTGARAGNPVHVRNPVYIAAGHIKASRPQTDIKSLCGVLNGIHPVFLEAFVRAEHSTVPAGVHLRKAVATFLLVQS